MSQKSKKQPQGSWMLKNRNEPCDLQKLPKCSAKAKSTGNRCRNPAMKNKKVCYLHGGKSTGAPIGNQNALKHGFFTQRAISERQHIKKLLKDINQLVKNIENTK